MDSLGDLKNNAVKSATYDTILQITLRIISFILNAFIVRHVSSATFAVMTVRLYLLYATGLLLAREAFRRAALGKRSSTEIRKLINLIWLGSVFSIPLSFLGWVVWCYIMKIPPKEVTVHYETGVLFILFSIIIEVATEVPYILSELHLWTKTKVIVEGSMQLLRSVLLALGIYLWPGKAVLIFGCSYAIGSVVYLISYYCLYVVTFKDKEKGQKMLIPNFRSLLPAFKSNCINEEVDMELWYVAWSFFKQGWIKETLTEGELYLMNFFPLVSLSQQGVYQVVNNLGSLAARLVFRSVETAAYKFFAQTLQRGVLIKDQDKAKMAEVTKSLRSLLSNMVMVSLVILTYGYSYSYTLLWLYGGNSLAEEGKLLMRAQCFYVVFLAVNGITEAYVFAAMSDIELEKHNHSLVFFSIIYVIVTVIATYFLAAVGFIIGNCINMLLRIIHSFYYIQNHFKETDHGVIGWLVTSNKVPVVFFSIFILNFCSEMYVCPIHVMLHLITGVCSLILLVYLLRFEMKTGIEIILNVADKIIRRINKNFVNENNYKDKFSEIIIIDSIHWFLYRRDIKMKQT